VFFCVETWYNLEKCIYGRKRKWQIAERATRDHTHKAQEGILFLKGVERVGVSNIPIPMEGQPLQALRVLRDTKSR
jgi:hypothetical protein